MSRALAMWVFVYLTCPVGTQAQEPRYLGQQPPGLESQLFAPGLISDPEVYEYGSVFSADGLEMFYGVELGHRAEIRMVRWTGSRWSAPTVLVSHERYSFGDPFLAPDGQRLYFISNRPLDAQTAEPKDFDIWYIPRDGDGWGDLFQPDRINSSADEYYVSFASSGRLYFASNRNAGSRRRNFDVYAAHATASGFAMP